MMSSGASPHRRSSPLRQRTGWRSPSGWATRDSPRTCRRTASIGRQPSPGSEPPDASGAGGRPRPTPMTIEPVTRVLDEATWRPLIEQGAEVDRRRGDHEDPLAGVVRIALADDTEVDVVVGRWRWGAAGGRSRRANERPGRHDSRAHDERPAAGRTVALARSPGSLTTPCSRSRRWPLFWIIPYNEASIRQGRLLTLRHLDQGTGGRVATGQAVFRHSCLQRRSRHDLRWRHPRSSAAAPSSAPSA